MTGASSAPAAPDRARATRVSRAFVLGMFMSLVGYAYVGRFRRGLVAVAVAALVVWSISHLPFGLLDHRPIAAIAAVSHVVATFGFGVDAGLIARRGQDRTGLWYQELTFYVVLFAAWIGVVVAAQRINDATLLKATQVCGRSWGMEPAIWPEDCVLVIPNDRWSRGDIAYFRRETGARFGRIVALPGDLIEMRAGVPLVNGSPLVQTPALRSPDDATSFQPDMSVPLREVNAEGRDYTVLKIPSWRQGRRDDFAERPVAEGHVFVLADVRDFVADSRSFGDVPLAKVLGKPVMVSRSPDWSRFGEPTR